MYLYLVHVMFSSELNITYLHVAGRSMIYLKKTKKKTVKIWSGKEFESQDSKRWCRPSFIHSSEFYKAAVRVLNPNSRDSVMQIHKKCHVEIWKNRPKLQII